MFEKLKNNLPERVCYRVNDKRPTKNLNNKKQFNCKCFLYFFKVNHNQMDFFLQFQVVLPNSRSKPRRPKVNKNPIKKEKDEKKKNQ